MLPVLLVHGIWDTGSKLAPIAHALEAAGAPKAECITLSINDGSARLLDLAAEVAKAAEALGPRIDLVGFSMGALVSRVYVQRLGGKDRVRRFVSIAGPHSGTVWARFAAARALGIRDMAPGSALLRELAADPDPWGSVEVHTLWTPFDGMIVPPRSSVLARSRSDRTFPIGLHRWLVTDPRAIAHVVDLLKAP
jgi:triacylglycerol esterase/lipase EstA (alpha/beta hydrolase family)